MHQNCVLGRCVCVFVFMLGLMGVDCRSRRSSSSDLLAFCVVLSVVLMVLTWHVNEPIGLGKEVGRGDVVYVMALQELGKLVRYEEGPLLV